MLSAFLFIGGIGFIASLLLAAAARVFYVYTDPRIEEVEDALPGANCGGCGNPGCGGAARAIVEGKCPPNVCVACGPEVHTKIAGLLGVEAKEKEPRVARPTCSHGILSADLKYVYNGVDDCQAAVLLNGGPKECPIGCLGLGTCERACPFHAISMGPDRLPVVDRDLCVGCGTCERVCPKHAIALTSTTERLISEYAVSGCTAPCQRGCPTGIDIPGFIREIRKGNYAGALLVIKERCPLPLVCGYICPAPCELECRRGLVDEAIAINPLKRFVAEWEMETDHRLSPYKAPQNGHKIALVGGGAEGLTAAYYLARLGFQPTIFEARLQLGGILRYVISEDRLPRRILDHDIDGVLEMGVEAKTGMALGRDFTVSSLLKQGFDGVLLTTGGLDSRKILYPDHAGHDWSVCSVFTMLDFLTALEQGSDMDVGRRVVIVGDGLKSLEAAHRCLEMNARSVTVVSHKPLHSLPVEFHETRRLRSQGIEVRFSTCVSAMEGVYEKLHRVALEDLDLPHEPAESPMLEADTLILSAGRLPELIFVHASEDGGGAATGIAWRTVEAFRTFPGANGAGLFTPPEPGRISDSSAVVKAISSGRRLARALHQHFTNDALDPADRTVPGACDVPAVKEVRGVSPRERARPLRSDVMGPNASSWIFPLEFPGLDEGAAKQEADRCLQCGLVCYERDQQPTAAD
jgi:formate dehydrogenase beta subunit